MIHPTPTMRRGEVIAFLKENYGLKEYRIRVLFEENVIRKMPKLYKRQKQAYYSREQIMDDVVHKGHLAEVNRESGVAGSAAAHN